MAKFIEIKGKYYNLDLVSEITEIKDLNSPRHPPIWSFYILTTDSEAEFVSDTKEELEAIYNKLINALPKE